MFKSSGFFLSNLYPHCGAWTHNTEIKSCMLCTDWARQASLQVKFLIFVTILGKKGCSNRPHWFWWLKQVEVYFQLWESPGQIFTDRGPGRSDSRNQASSVLWHHHPQAMLLRLPSGSPASQPKGPHGGPHREDLGARPGGRPPPAGSSHPIGYNSVTWPHWASRGAGKCGLGLREDQEIGILRVHIHFSCCLCVLRSCFCVESSTVECFFLWLKPFTVS